VSLTRIPRIPKEKLDSCLRRNDIESFIHKGFIKNMGTGFTFCLALNAGGQKKTVPIFKNCIVFPGQRAKII
jgi:hypothetical protein